MVLGGTGCGSSGGATTVTTAAKPVESTAAQIKEKAKAEAEARKQQLAQKKEEAKEAAEQKKQEARERNQEKKEESVSSGGASSGSGGGQTVPSDIANKNLKDAEAELEGMGISFTTNSYGHIVILHGDWGVCSTTPSPGQPVSGTVVLNLGHFSCGA